MNAQLGWPTTAGGGHLRSRLVLAALAVGSLLCAVAAADAPPPGVIRFRGHMALGYSEGEFRRWYITDAVIDEENPERSTISLAIDLASLDTGNDTRDRHLRSADFFDVDHYPVATVRLSAVEVEDAQHFAATVQLDLHGRSQSFPMRFAIVDRAARRIASEITLKRSEFGVGAAKGVFNPFRVDDEVHVMIEAVVPASQDSRASVPSQRTRE
jgi:polyisoprenoid-binding protein YceI